jgi:Polyketide cyclase / dehydrase and lipid transport
MNSPGFPRGPVRPILAGMRRVEAEALVGARREEVWRLYDDIAGTPRWLPFVEDVLYVSGPARAGTVYRERTRLAGLPATEQWEIVEYRPQSRQVHVSFAHGLESALVITFEARGTGTWVHQSAELRSTLWGPLGWVHELLASIPAGRGVKAAVTGAKRAFEEGLR